MNDALFDELEQTLHTAGPSAAIERLCTDLRERKDYGNLFYALLLKKRHELGVSPFPTSSAQELPAEAHEPYENAIRESGRLIGKLYLDAGEIGRAWPYFRIIGEPDAVVAALDNFKPDAEADCQPLIDIAYHQGLHPRKGFDLVLDHYGICSAITTLGSYEFPHGPEVRAYCIQRLVRALHEQLRERLEAEIARAEGKPPGTTSVHEMIAGRDWLFSDDYYHVDVSHLSSVVQMSIHLSPGAELQLARDLCAYGEKLSPRFQYDGDPPFEQQYRDYGIYLAVLAGDQVEEGIAHFRAKADAADPETIGHYPAEVLVGLLLRLDRVGEALDVARTHLRTIDEARLTCPGVTQLCQRMKDYRSLAEVAKERDDPVNYLAGLLAAKG